MREITVFQKPKQRRKSVTLVALEFHFAITQCVTQFYSKCIRKL